ncbi:hypothetical protein ACQJBY_054159 [Aegilops geniculata]
MAPDPWPPFLPSSFSPAPQQRALVRPRPRRHLLVRPPPPASPPPHPCPVPLTSAATRPEPRRPPSPAVVPLPCARIRRPPPPGPLLHHASSPTCLASVLAGSPSASPRSPASRPSCHPLIATTGHQRLQPPGRIALRRSPKQRQASAASPLLVTTKPQWCCGRASALSRRRRRASLDPLPPQPPNLGRQDHTRTAMHLLCDFCQVPQRRVKSLAVTMNIYGECTTSNRVR